MKGKEEKSRTLNKPNVFLYSTFYSLKEKGTDPREIQHYSA